MDAVRAVDPGGHEAWSVTETHLPPCSHCSSSSIAASNSKLAAGRLGGLEGGVAKGGAGTGEQGHKVLEFPRLVPVSPGQQLLVRGAPEACGDGMFTQARCQSDGGLEQVHADLFMTRQRQALDGELAGLIKFASRDQ